MFKIIPSKNCKCETKYIIIQYAMNHYYNDSKTLQNVLFVNN